MSEKFDFPVTRHIMDRLDEWVVELASPLLPAEPVEVNLPHMSGVLWKFREETERVVLVCKAVRMVSGIRVAFMLAELGYIAESGTILRTISDFSNEVISVCEGYGKGLPTTDQKKFVEQYFAPMPKDLDDFEKQSRERWVTRKELFAGHVRWATEKGGDPARLRKLLGFLLYGYDKFVHGGYITAMELYNPSTGSFMLRGHESNEKREVNKRAVASKLHEVLTALCCMAGLWKLPDLVDVISRSADDLHQSGELTAWLILYARRLILLFLRLLTR
jgi:hypothetical protein